MASSVSKLYATRAKVAGPITSICWWNEAVGTARQVVLGTSADRADALAGMLRSEHRHDTPEIVATPIVTGDPAYLDWVGRETHRWSTE